MKTKRRIQTVSRKWKQKDEYKPTVVNENKKMKTPDSRKWKQKDEYKLLVVNENKKIDTNR